MKVEKHLIANALRFSATIALGVLASAALLGGASPALAQSGELEGVIFVEDVPGFVGPDDADTVIACLPNGECVTGEDNVLTGFRPATWPNLREVDDDLVIEADVDVQATAFGRIIARDGFIAESFTSGPEDIIEDGTLDAAASVGNRAVAITPDAAWAPNNFGNSDAVWVSYADTTTGPTPATLGTTMTVSESFTVPDGATGALDGFVFADDTARVVLFQDGVAIDPPVFEYNREQDTCAAGPIGCEDDEGGDLSEGDEDWQTGGNPPLDLGALPPGEYELQFTALQDSEGGTTESNPFGLMYAFDVTLDPPTQADVCWTFDGGAPGEKVCVSVADCPDCTSAPAECAIDGAAINLTSGAPGDAICDDIATQFFEDGVTDVLEEFQFVVGFDVPETSQPGSVRVATCTTTSPPATYVPICRDPASKVVDATVNNDISLSAVETPRCLTVGGKTYC